LELSEVYEIFFPKIYNYIFYRVLHKQIAEDLVSVVFLKVAEKFDTFKPDRGSVSAWIFKIAENTLNDYFRSPRAILISFDDLPANETPKLDFDEQTMLIKNETRQELYGALSKLDERTRDIISQKYFLEKTLRQIADEKGMNEKTVSTIHNRGLASLRKAVGDGVKL